MLDADGQPLFWIVFFLFLWIALLIWLAIFPRPKRRKGDPSWRITDFPVPTQKTKRPTPYRGNPPAPQTTKPGQKQ